MIRLRSKESRTQKRFHLRQEIDSKSELNESLPEETAPVANRFSSNSLSILTAEHLLSQPYRPKLHRFRSHYRCVNI